MTFPGLGSTLGKQPSDYLLLFSPSVVSDSLRPNGLQHTGFPVHHLPDFAQTHVHWVSDAIQPSHPLLPPSPPALSLSQHQGFFAMNWLYTLGGQSIGASASALVLPINIQSWFPLGSTGFFWLIRQLDLIAFGFSYREKRCWLNKLWVFQPLWQQSVSINY